MRNLKAIIYTAALALLLATTASADVKIKSRLTVAGQSTESTVYIKGKRQRGERDLGGMKTASLTECDLKRDVQLNLNAKTYYVNSYADSGVGNGTLPEKASETESPNQKGGTVTTTVTMKDTGERKQMFGYTARHVLTVVESKSSPDACTPVDSRTETDGWYIDADFALDCFVNRQFRQPNARAQQAGCQDRQVFKQNGAGRLGYPVYVKTTMRGEKGEEDTVMVQEALDISQATLDAALFEIPTDFREVKSQAELFSAASFVQGVSETDDEGEKESRPQTSSIPSRGDGVQGGAGAQSSPASLPATVGAKRSGVVRLGVVAVKTAGVGEGMDAGELSAAVRNGLAEYLKGATVELIGIEAKLPSQVEAEAKQKSCDFVIYATVSHKKGGGGFGKLFGKVAPVVADVVPGAAGSDVADEAIYAGKEVVYSTADAAQNIKAKDELTLEVRLHKTADPSAVLERQFRSKARSDGDDILTPLVEQAAQAVLHSLTAK